ncbi:MAG: hypothetical protein J6R77_01365 [Clostridia bacterium]|nr:hypothetical protein [Clostridia bacterium]
MFGYVKVYQPELKIGEWEQYKGVYCSLCHTLGKRYGLPARFLLNYDLTLLALFHMALKPECAGFSKGRCPFNPTKKCLRCHGEDDLAYAADAAVLLTYYKLRDNVADSGFFRRLLVRPLLWMVAPMKRRACRLRPQMAEQMAAYYAAQQAVEREETPSPDAAAHPTAALLSALTVGEETDPEAKAARARFGYCLGRWIYFIDAADDWEGDQKAGNFNPFRATAEGESPRAYMKEALNACLSECLTSWHLLERYHFDSILQNILQYGMPAATRQVTAPDKPGEKGQTHERSV